MKCPACAANVNFDNNQTTFKCDYCQNTISIIKPITVSNVVQGLNDSDQNRYSNYLSILEQSMKAGNYLEAYNYCNKALEVNPKSGSLWENKAICSFWLNTLDSLTNDKATEIITYLNASKQNDSNSETYQQTAVSISDNLFTIAQYKYKSNIPSTMLNNKTVYTNEGIRQNFQCIELMDICYQIYPKIEYLKKAVEMITSGRLKWVKKIGNTVYNSTDANTIGFDAAKKREYLINKIRTVEANYEPPVLVKSMNAGVAVIIAFLVLFALIFICSILGKR